MEKLATLIYDGSFSGFLTAIFEAFARRHQVASISPRHRWQEGLFSESVEIETDPLKARRVWEGLKSKHVNTRNDVYFAFLSECEGVEDTLYRVIRKVLSPGNSRGINYADADVLQLHQLARKVGREKHRMEAFVRFMQTRDGIYFANISPDFNVLPLISRHFRTRYADQEWLIYDLHRRYGLHYDLRRVRMVLLDLDKEAVNTLRKDERFSDAEAAWQGLWQNYFQSTNIRSRINTRLHLQHVPRRYHRHLVEKHPLGATG